MIIPHENWGITEERIERIEETLSSLGVTVYPNKEDRYKALKMAPEDVKVVILGQDPYHDGSATGLAFDNYLSGHWKGSPSLDNIIKELESEGFISEEDYTDENNGSYLGHLPPQGVLLLNTALSVEKSKPNSHSKYWSEFIEDIFSKLNEQDNIVYLAWGAFAQALIAKSINNPTAIIIETTHPSPFSARKPSKYAPAFIGSGCFTKVNNELTKMGKEPIFW